MANYLNQDNSRFIQDKENMIYIDKSLLLNYTNLYMKKSNSKFMCITRPRRFGKTMALSMLNAYYSKGANSKELFASLKISQEPNYKEHLNKHNVIWIDMASLYSTISNKDNFTVELTERIIKDLDESYPNVLTESEKTLADSIRKIYNNTKETFIFLIDEWDVVFRESSNNKLKDDYIMLLRSLFKASDTSTCIDLVYMTGILPIKRYNTESALNNFSEYTMLRSKPLSEYIGFTKDEVIGLCEKYNMDYKEMKRWYDGYNLDGIELYNPKSVVEAITNREYDDYWVSTSALENVVHYLSFKDKDLKEELVKMLADTSVSVKIRKFNNDISIINSKDDVLTLLIHLGYLTYDSLNKECYIPNYEIKNELEIALDELEWFDLYEPINDSLSAVKALYNKDSNTINKILDKNHELYANALNKNNEQVLELLTIFSFNTLRSTHYMHKEKSNIKGRADIIYIPRNDGPAIIVELKYNKEASVAIEQIKNKEYHSLLDEYHGKVILVGINYDDSMKHSTVIEEIEI